MKTCLTLVPAVLALTALPLFGCGSDTSPTSTGSGGSTGGAVTPSGGVTMGGSGGTTTGPTASGGTLTSGGTPASGGQAQGGASPQGGSATGGAPPSTGGRTATGGSATGGDASGGSATGGSVAGGSQTGGSAAGGSGTGGSATGGGVAGGSATGGRATGGTNTGGVSTGGASAGGRTSTGGTGGPGSGGTLNTGGSGGTGTSTYPVSSGTPTVYLAGDSTCQTYAPNASDQQGWGQRFQEFFNTTDVIVVNKAIGGRSSKSFIDEGHLTEILNVIKPGDYLFAQWGINDRYTSDATRYTNPATTFRTYLKQYIDGARGKNAIPVLLTPTPRHQLSNGLPTNGFPEYCAAIIAVGAETNTPVIDLQSMALAYYTKVGDAYVSSTLILDALHFVSAGAYQMARMVALGVSAVGLPISPYVIQSKLAAH